MRVVVTGSAGFLGRYVAEHFRDEGWDVRGFDLMQTSIDGVEGIVGDLRDSETVRTAVRGFDAVAHVGAVGDVYLAGDQPALAASVNVTGTANVLDAAVDAGARVIYASTWEVYGEPAYQPIDESHPTNPDHPYSITKLAGEALTLAAVHLRGLSAVALRLGTAFGVGLRPNSVFRIFVDRARQGLPITIQGDGSQSRQFTHAGDIARAFEIAARSASNGEVFNIVGSETTSIRQLAQAIVDVVPTKLEFGPARAGDVVPALVDNSKAKRLLGWSPAIRLTDALLEIVDERR